MRKVKEFVEAVDMKNKEDHIKVFTVTFENLVVSPGLWLRDHFHRFDSKVLTLDEQDIQYLYNKYKPLYEEDISQRNIKIQKEKLEDIGRKAKEINKLSAQIDSIKKELE
ncbi:MAG: hypothetical protein ACJAVA_000353 [Flavobacteriaceae bacterium]|jgi:hypothetical protein